MMTTRKFYQLDNRTWKMDGGNYRMELRNSIWELSRCYMGELEHVGDYETLAGAMSAAQDDYPKHF